MSLDGSWKVTMQTPMGSQQATLNLKADGSALTGNMTSPMGSQEVVEGKADGNKGSWKINMTAPMKMTIEFSADANGDDIAGTMKAGMMGTSTFSRKRA